MDPGTVLAIVSLIIQVVSSADKVIQGFDHIQNAPRELRDFRAAVFRLQRNFETLQPSSLHADDLQPIEETLELCAHLFQQHDSVQSQGMVNSVLRGTWSIRNNQKLTKYRYRIYEHYVTILIPALVAASGRSSDHNTIGSSLSGSTKFQAQGERPEHTGTTVSLEDLGSLRQLVENLGISEERAATERTLSELDRQLRRCWIKLGLQDDDVFDSAGLTDRRRQSNVTFEVAPVTLYMNDVPEQHKKLKLERVHIMARDDESRILLYQNREATIQVTHIVPKGSIPWTSPQYHKRVSFLHPHVITVVDGEGYHLYQVDPQYSFNKIETCESFQSMLRERELRGTFLAAEIREGGVTLCRMQFIRFWRRHEIGKGEILTLTFLQTSHDAAAQHKEVNLANYQATPEYHARRLATVVVRRPTESNTLDIIPRRAHAKSLVVRFGSVQDANSFRERYRALHTSTPSLQPATPTLRPAPSPLIPTTSSSGTPSLYSTSTSSRTPCTTAAPTPSDHTWITLPPPKLSIFDLDDGVPGTMLPPPAIPSSPVKLENASTSPQMVVGPLGFEDNSDEWHTPVYAAIKKEERGA